MPNKLEWEQYGHNGIKASSKARLNTTFVVEVGLKTDGNTFFGVYKFDIDGFKWHIKKPSAIDGIVHCQALEDEWNAEQEE